MFAFGCISSTKIKKASWPFLIFGAAASGEAMAD
jgi:hypothetical protein